jgi:signal peptidase II
MTASWLLPAVLVLILDQVSKRLAQSQRTKRPGFPARPGPRIRPVKNANIGFGLIREPRVLILVWGVAILGTVLAINWFAPLQGQIALVGLGAAMGGATGNLMDMLRRGAVMDFIDLRIWPVFNLADVAIVAGAVVAVWSMVGVG